MKVAAPQYPPDGGWAVPTVATMIRLVPEGFAAQAYRSSDSAIFVVAQEKRGFFDEQRAGARMKIQLRNPAWSGSGAYG